VKQNLVQTPTIKDFPALGARDEMLFLVEPSEYVSTYQVTGKSVKLWLLISAARWVSRL
jgi:hypothetical protein